MQPELADIINREWCKRYGGTPTSETAQLINRIKLLCADLDCWLANAQANQREYLKLEAKLKELTICHGDKNPASPTAG